MNLNKIIIICVFYIFIVNIVSSLSILGNEFVLIRVRVPPSNKRISHHKIMHRNYHRHSKPNKEVPGKQTDSSYGKLSDSILDKKLVTYSRHQRHEPQHVEKSVVKEHLEKPIAKLEPIKIIKLIESSADQHHYHNGGKKSPVDTTNFVEEEPTYYYQYQTHNDGYNYLQDHQQDVIWRDPIYYDSHKNQLETKEVVMDQGTIPNVYYKTHDANHLPSGIIKELVEFIKIKRGENRKYHYKQHQEKEIPITAQEEYHFYKKTPSTNYRYAAEQVIPIEGYAEYEKPSDHHLTVQHTLAETNHPYVMPVSIFPETSHFYSPPSETHTSTYPEYGEEKFVTDYQKYLPYSQIHSEYQAEFKQNVNNDNLNAKDDWSTVVKNPHAAETYMGYDSYSAGHVQGLDSDGYN